MSDPQPAVPLPPKEDPEALVLRGRQPPVVRFRRTLIIGITAVIAAFLVTLSWIALEPTSGRRTASALDLDEQTAKPTPDVLANVPKSYGDVPRLGPPLPGDLGRAILDHDRSLLDPAPTSQDRNAYQQSPAQSAAELDRERAEAAQMSARTAGLMVQLESNDMRGSSALTGASEASSQPALLAQAAVPASQEHKIEFTRAEEGSLGARQIDAAPSRWLLSAGTVIPASLITGLNSDLPGMVIAQVTENVRDSATGQWILVPQGARLIGKYDSVVAYGQRRALVIWSRIVFPDGSSIELDHMPATDASGYSGVSDKVDSHGWQLLKGIGMSTLLGVGTQLGFGGSGSDLVRAIRESAQENAARAGDQITSRNLEVQPTIKVRPGWPIRALINKDLVLRPWQG